MDTTSIKWNLLCMFGWGGGKRGGGGGRGGREISILCNNNFTGDSQ